MPAGRGNMAEISINNLHDVEVTREPDAEDAKNSDEKENMHNKSANVLDLSEHESVHSWLAGMLVYSSDSLCGLAIDETIPKYSGWNVTPPPLFFEKRRRFRNKPSDHNWDAVVMLKELCRSGVPPILRCCVWVNEIMSLSDLGKFNSCDYGTVGKANIVEDTYELVESIVFATEEDRHEAPTPYFGLSTELMDRIYEGLGDGTVTIEGKHRMARVLHSVQTVLSVTYAPMLPVLCTILLSFMKEKYVYTVLKEITNNTDGRFMPLTPVERAAWSKTFSDMVHKMFPFTYFEMEKCGALSQQGLSPIFDMFFVTIFKRVHIYHLMDIYIVEGGKILFRIGLALLRFYKRKMKKMKITSADGWWDQIREYAHSDDFNFENLILWAYTFTYYRLRKKVRFPRRRTINRMIKHNEKWAEQNLAVVVPSEPPRPLGLVQGSYACQLGSPTSTRVDLAKWVPPTLRSTKLDLVYSTNEHGATLGNFYYCVRKLKHSLLLMKVKENDAVIGMFASSAWKVHPQIYGDGGCFLFQIKPEPKCYKWNPPSSGSIDDEKNGALMEQFMTGKRTYISMGGNADGSSGLLINEDLSKGRSAPALGFNNEPLAGDDLPEFDILLVEVYRFVREIDGKGIDGDDAACVWNYD
mmetsp:Transcript_37475/g.43624  ORF Transcript_37475/g.43624 Transcript_37475/m.43624 type:complete len:639 (-) Transcript_37475:80-1996(-)